MAYTRVFQYADVTEVWQYERELPQRPQTAVSGRKRGLSGRPRPRSRRSVQRARAFFTKLVLHNVYNAEVTHFITLTFPLDVAVTRKEAARYFSKFVARIEKNLGISSLRYVSVFERTQEGQIHLHVLTFNLPHATEKLERKNRNFQRCWQRGFVDVSLPKGNAQRAGNYLAKYFQKELEHQDNAGRRCYSASRNILRPSAYGSSSLSSYLDLVIHTDDLDNQYTYPTQYLGNCNYQRYKRKKQ